MKLLRYVLAAALVVASEFGGVASAANTLWQGPIDAACVTFTGCQIASPGNPGALISISIAPPPAMVTLQITGTFTGTMVLEGSIDGKNFVSQTLTPSAGGAGVSSFTTTGLWTGVISGVSYLQIRGSSWTSGTANVSILYNVLSVKGYSQYCLACVGTANYRYGSVLSVPADGSATAALTFSTPFLATTSAVVLSPGAYSGSDNAAVMCRSSAVTVNGCTISCGGGASGSTVTVYYVADGI